MISIYNSLVFLVPLLLYSVPARPISEGAAPAHTGLRPARFTRVLPELKKQKNKKIFLQNVIAVFVFSNNRCKNACKMLADLCSCFHQSPTRPNFGRSRLKDFVSFARILVVRALDCAQFLLHPALFPT